ncbi:MAG: S8 family serine peptidase [Acetatifactor sp.]
MKKHNWKKSALALLLVSCMTLGSAGAVLADTTEDANTTEAADATEAAETAEAAETGADFVVEEVEDEELSGLPVGAEEVPEEEPAYAADEQVRVFIVLEDEAVIDAGYEMDGLSVNDDAMRLSSQIEKEQETVVEEIQKEALGGNRLDVRYNFSILTNAVSANVAYGDIEAIREVDGVAEVYIVPVYDVQETADPNTITAGDMVGSYATWNSGYTGAGQRIAIIDTGIDSDHPSFDGDAFDYGLAETAEKEGVAVSTYDLLTKEEIGAVLSNLNASAMYSGLDADKLYVNDKIPFAFNYVDQNLDITHDNDGEGDHGTHVSGIACANLYVPAGNNTYAKQENGVVGIAPDAQLITMKVFGTGGGAYTDDYMAAIEDAILLGADAINLSLGSSSAGESAASQAYINEIMDKLCGSSVVVSISAGNAGAWSDSSLYGANIADDVNLDTVGSPGSYTNAFTVASANNSGYTGPAPLTFDGTLAVSFADAGDGGAIPAFTTLDTANGGGTEYDYVLIAGYGEAEDYAGLDVAGKIVLVSRGVNYFSVKHANAAAAGALAVIVYDNQDGALVNMSLSDSGASIPAAFISKADAAAIVKQSVAQSNGTYTGKITVANKITTQYDVADGYTMSDFSSWGVPGSLELKPEITAPGGNIYSTLTDGQYGQMSGTSMAAPSVAGMSALMAQYIKENNLSEKTGLSIRTLSQSLLMSTAVPLTDPEVEAEYSPRNQGAGLANVEKATTSPAYILVGNKDGNDGKVKVELGDDPQKTGVYEFSFDVYNMSDVPQFYTTDSSILTEELLDETFIAGYSHKLNPSVEISSNGQSSLYDINKDGKTDKEDARTLLSYVNGSVSLAVVDSYWQDFDFNSDGVVDTADVHEFLVQLETEGSAVRTAEKMVVVEDCTTVTVKVTLSEEDKAYLANFASGMYVDGFIYLKGTVDLSVPMLAFYGCWGDSSMYEPFDLLEYMNNGSEWEYPYYSSVNANNQVVFNPTQYLTFTYAGDSSKYYYLSNMFSSVGDTAYIPDRNAMSSVSGDAVATVNYSLIRNASRVMVTITDVESGETYYIANIGSQIAEYYYANQATWTNTKYSASLNWKATDAEGNPLPEGTMVNISVTAVPAYYDDKEVSELDGTGLTWTVPMAIDNTAPVVTGSMSDLGDNKLQLTVSDNRYVAAVAVYEHDKKTKFGSWDVNQTEAGVETTLTIDYPTDVFYVKVLDYAGNYTTYRVNKSGEPDTAIATGITLDQTELTMIKGGTKQLTATVAPVTVVPDTVTWTSSDEQVATVDANGIITAVAAGTAVITATADAKDASGAELTASCNVTVEAIDVDLNGILWDEEGQVYWSTFNTGALPNYTKLSDAQDKDYMSAVMRADGKVIAATCGDSSTQASDLYLVDPADGYSATLLQGELMWCTDMTYSVALDVIWASYGPYLQLIDGSTGESGGYLNLTSKLDGYIVGVADAGIYVISDAEGNPYYDDVVYLVTENGTLYTFEYVLNLGMYVTEVGNTGISTNGGWYFNSLCYDASTDYLFWNMFADGSSEVVTYALKDTSTAEGYSVAAYELGSFPSGVWPVSGLYQAGAAAGQDSTAAKRVEELRGDREFESMELLTEAPQMDRPVTGR